MFLKRCKGDAAYIRTADEYNIVIDTGPSPKVTNLLNRLVPVWDRQIDLMILTHPHADHIGGASQIIEQFPVDRVLITEADYTSQLYQSLIDTITTHNVEVSKVVKGSEFELGDSLIKVLSPDPETLNDSDLNNTSIANLYSYNDFDILFTGDISQKVESKIIQDQLPEIEVLKVGHHGSDTSTSENFITRTSPSHAVISVGENNRYNHPSQATIDLLTKFGVNVLRTDQDSTVHFSTDGSLFKLIR
ncbi:MAG: MBL fold metallo-hydrolase [Patescibacteria group bacterium]